MKDERCRAEATWGQPVPPTPEPGARVPAGGGHPLRIDIATDADSDTSSRLDGSLARAIAEGPRSAETVIAEHVHWPLGLSVSHQDSLRTRMLHAIRIMVDRPSSAISVADLANAAGMSRSGFAKRFNEIFGLAPMGFLNRERLRLAAHLLASTSLPVKSVAVRTGFSSRSSFSRAFKGAFGIAPAAIRAFAGEEPAGPSDGRSSSPTVATGRGLDAEAELHFAETSEQDGRSAGLLSAAYERLRAICSATLDVAWDIDLKTGLVWWSEGMEQSFGYGPEQVGPDTAWCHEHIHPEDRQRVADGMRAACDRGDSLWRDTFRYRRADGSYALVDDRGTIIRDGSGKAARFVGAMRELR